MCARSEAAGAIGRRRGRAVACLLSGVILGKEDGGERIREMVGRGFGRGETDRVERKGRGGSVPRCRLFRVVGWDGEGGVRVMDDGSLRSVVDGVGGDSAWCIFGVEALLRHARPRGWTVQPEELRSRYFHVGPACFQVAFWARLDRRSREFLSLTRLTFPANRSDTFFVRDIHNRCQGLAGDWRSACSLALPACRLGRFALFLGFQWMMRPFVRVDAAGWSDMADARRWRRLDASCGNKARTWTRLTRQVR